MGGVTDLDKARRARGCKDTPEDVLHRALDKLEDGELWAGRSKLIVISVDESEGQYDMGFVCSNLRSSEIIVLADLLKADMRKSMGY